MANSDDLPNIALSGWAGVGTSSLTLIMAHLLKRKYYYLGSIFRQVDQKLGFKEGDKALREEFEREVQPIIGKTIDKYCDHILLNKDNVILETDIAAFRIGKNPKAFSIFIKASKEKRLERFATDGREEETNIDIRDKALQSAYLDLWNIDIFDEELINRKYNLVLDNSDMAIEDELLIIFREMQGNPAFKDVYDWGKLESKISKIVKEFWKVGKTGIRTQLAQKKLLLSPNELMEDIVKIFPEEIETFPKNIQEIFLGLV